MKYNVLYTHQKQKKVKAWKDVELGFLTVDQNKKAVLYDEKNIRIDNTFIENVSEGDDLDLPRHLVQVESIVSSETYQVKENKSTVEAKKPQTQPSFTSSMKPEKQQNTQENDTAQIEETGSEVKKRKLPILPFIKHKIKYQQTLAHHTPNSLSSISSVPNFPKQYNSLAKVKTELICFAHDAVRQTDFSFQNIPLRFPSYQTYRIYQSNLVTAYIQSMLNDLFQKVKTKSSATLSEFSQQSGFIKNFDFILYSKGQVKISNISSTNLSSSSSSPIEKIPEKDKGGLVLTGTANTLILSLLDYNQSDFSKDDIWIISLSSLFRFSSTIICRSLYYGVSGGKIHIAGLTSRDNSLMKELMPQIKTDKPIILRGCNISTEMTIMENLENYCPSTPLVDFLIDPGSSIDQNLLTSESRGSDIFEILEHMPEDEKNHFHVFIEGLVQKTISEFNLNLDQSQALLEFSNQLFSKSSTCPVLLVHGVFGSGKSYLIAIMTIFVTKAVAYFGDIAPPKILIASMTNTAVDNILNVILKLDFNDFIRVGSLKRISRNILPYAVQSKKRVEDDIKELQTLINGSDLTEEDEKSISMTIKRFQSLDSVHSTEASLKRASVVGATCLATSFPCLENMEFSIVILDEVSQITESMSLLPILKFNVRNLVLVGDPLQLPPTITSVDNNTALQKKLKFTLFDRLLESDVYTVMLRTQYRCHPYISNLSNQLFYKSVLKDGISLGDRAPLVEGLPPVCFINVSSGKELRQYGKQSLHNEGETDFIVDIIKSLFQNGIPSEEIGVISMYKLQAEKIESKLMIHSLVSQKQRERKKSQEIRISTVDAFQGAEMEIMIVSCVRSSYSSNQFLNNSHRINVALTRGRRHLFLVGNALLLKKYSCWKDIIDLHCKKNDNGFMDSDDFLSLLSSKTHSSSQIIRSKATNQPTSSVSRTIHQDPQSKNDNVSPKQPEKNMLSLMSTSQYRQATDDIDSFIADVESHFGDPYDEPTHSDQSQLSQTSNVDSDINDVAGLPSEDISNSNIPDSFEAFMNDATKASYDCLSEDQIIDEPLPEDLSSESQTDPGFLEMLKEMRK